LWQLTFDTIGEMELMHDCVRETLRLHPPLIMLMRYARTDVNVTSREGASYVIPKGSIVAVSPTVHHRLETSFKDANQFDPSR